MVGTCTMAATFFITLLNVTILVANRNDTIVIRGLVNQAVMASTIIIWNINNTDMLKFTKKVFVKEE